MKLLAFAPPLVSISVLTLVAVLPWGLPSEHRFFLPMLPLIAIHYWSLRRPEYVPDWYVFVAGLSLDVLTHGPLGYWALMYLLAHVLGVFSVFYGHRGQMMRVALFGGALCAVTTVAWTVSSLYVLEVADFRPYALGAGLSALASLVIVPVLHVLGPAPIPRDNASLKRGV